MGNFFLTAFISRRLRESSKRSRFLNFVRISALISVVLGNLALIISLSILAGYEKQLKEQASHFCSHIVVYKINKDAIFDYKMLIALIKGNFKGIKKISPSIEREALMSSKTDIQGVLIKSVEGETFEKFSVIQGSSKFSKGKHNEIIISKRQADNLRLKVGDKVIIYSIPEKSLDIYSPNIQQMEVRGIYQSGLVKYDDVFVFAKGSTIARIFSSLQPDYNLIEIDLDKMEDAEVLAPQLNEVLGFQYIVTTIYELNSAMFNWIELQKEPIPLVLGLISIVAIANIITVLLILVVEKTHTIGILRALGVKSKQIIGIFVLQGLSIGFVGSVVGCFLGFVFAFLQSNFHIIKLKGEIYFLEFLPVEISFWHYVIVFSVTMVITFLATLIPSYLATRVDEIRAIRFS